jgi:hypothetical protein
MEGDQKFNIALDAPLDVNSNDMLVPVNSPKFAFNRQRYLGSLLQNSVRYEDDGWFAGWWGHNFGFQTSGNNYITPALGDPSQLVVYKAKTSDGVDYYVMQQRDLGIDIAFAVTGWSKWLQGSGSVTRAGNTVTINGTTTKGDSFTASVNPYTGELISFTGTGLTALSSGGDSFQLTVTAGGNAADNYIQIRKGRKVTIADFTLNYKRDATNSQWSNIFQLSDGNNLSIIPPLNLTFNILSQAVQNVGLETEFVRAEVEHTTAAVVLVKYETRDKWSRGCFVLAEPIATQIDSLTPISENGSQPFYRKYNTQTAEMLWNAPPWIFDAHPSCLFQYGLPIWMYFGADFSFTNQIIGNGSTGPQIILTCTGGSNIVANIQDEITDNNIILSRWEYNFNGTGWVDAATPTALPQEYLSLPIYPEEGIFTQDYPILFRCINGNANYPVEVGHYFNISTVVRVMGNYKYDSGTGNYVLSNVVANAMMDPAVSTLTLEPAALNAVDITDTNLFSSSGSTFSIKVPISHYAYTYILVESPELNKGDVTGFTYRILPNAEVGARVWRIDNNGDGTGVGNWALNVVTPVLTGVGTYMNDAVRHQVTFTMNGTKNLYLEKDNEKYAYPPFVSPGGIMQTYMPSSRNNTTVRALIDVEVDKYIHTASFMPNVVSVDDFSSTTINGLQMSSIHVETDPDSTVQHITLSIGRSGLNKMELEYDAHTGNWTYISDDFQTYDLILWTPGVDGIAPINTITLTAKDKYTIDFYRTFILDKKGEMIPASIVSQTGNLLELTAGYGTVDLQSSSLSGATEVNFLYSQQTPNTVKVFVGITNNAQVIYLPQGIFMRNPDTIGYVSVSASTMSFTYNGSTYTLYMDVVNAAADLTYTTTDIRTGEVKQPHKENTIGDVRMFVKQFWASTVDTENFWWINSTHVLELTKYDMILWQKTNQIDDWMGDVWSIQSSGPRGNWVTGDDLYYAVSNSFNSDPYFFKLQASKDNGTQALIIKYIRPIGANFTSPNFGTTIIPIHKANLGDTLSTGMIDAYVELSAGGLIGASQITNTTISDILYIGLQYTRGLTQWIINAGSGSVVILGYGCIGLDGTVTGNEIPVVCCGPAGFSAAVRPLSELPETGEDGFPEDVFGTATQQWYVYQNAVKQIVSHFTCNSGNFTPVPLQLNNNVVTRYESESFRVAHLFDLLPQVIGIGQLFQGTDDPILDALGIVASIILPGLFVLNTAYAYFNYINHSTGQYAYVYRNTLQERIDELKTDQDIQFGVIEHRESYSDVFSSATIWLDIILKGITGDIEAPVSYKVNESQNQSATDDAEGRKWSQFFVENVASTIGTSLYTSGIPTSLASTIKEIYTLSMFYSTCDKIQCWSGPGYVNHNLVGQCLAQSVTDTQLDGKKYGYFVVLRKLTEAILELEYQILKYGYDFLNDIAATSGSGSSGNGMTWLQGLGPIGVVIFIVQETMHVMMILNKLSADYIIPALADALGSEVGQAFSIGKIQKRSLELEGVHTYGDKPMSFFYPAFGHSDSIEYTNEEIETDYIESSQDVNFSGKYMSFRVYTKDNWTIDSNNDFRGDAGEFSLFPSDPDALRGQLYSVRVVCKSKHNEHTKAPINMSVVEGVTALMPEGTPFKNEQIGVSPPVFPAPPIFDYMVDAGWKLSFTATSGAIAWVAVDDTKVIDGPASNIVLTGSFLGIASSYTAIEVKKIYNSRYLRPVAITPNCIALNINRYNVVHDCRVYHAFDGYGNRIIDWHGGEGMDKTFLYQQYQYQVNDHFKRSNILPPSEFRGYFQGVPSIDVRSYDRVANVITALSNGQGLGNPIPGEDKDARRYSIPVHSERLSTLPAMVRILGPYKLAVVDGVTSLVTVLRNTQNMYKAPSSVDFNINAAPYRATDEYINNVDTQHGIVAMQEQVPISGLTFLGATTKEAYFYSEATRLYYSFNGGREITKQDVLNRFKDVKEGIWDFVNQEVMFKCLLGPDVLVCRLDAGTILGEVYPPNETVYNVTKPGKPGDFKLLSMPGGTLYQGPRRFIVNRFVITNYMIGGIISNMKKWTKLSRYDYPPERDYGWDYINFDTNTPGGAVKGWTHNAYRLVTAMLGLNEETDAKYEWAITFAWTEQMEQIFSQNEYVTVNVRAETVTLSGTKLSEVTHIFLFKECFTREGNAGYYTFQFQSNNGIGNRERLYLWCDGMVAIEDIELSAKSLTPHRTQILNTQGDLKGLSEQ